MKRALITGIAGQDGSYLAEYLLRLGYEVHGIIRRHSQPATQRIDHLYQDPHTPNAQLKLHYGDLAGDDLTGLLFEIKPDEIYNLAAQSHVRTSFDIPVGTADVTALGPLRLLEAIRRAGMTDTVRFYQASSSEMFGDAPGPQNEKTPFRPRSPYACAKVFAHHTVVNYHEAYGIFAVSGILFNHESPRRGETFVTRKITRAVGRIAHGLQDNLYLGNLDAQRDWGYAPEYVAAMHTMLQNSSPRDYVIGTGETHTVQEFVERAFAEVGLDWKKYVEYDPRYDRPTEVPYLLADATKAKEELGWTPRVTFPRLVKIMVEHDLVLAQQEKRSRG